MTREIAFIDRNVDDLGTLLAGIRPEVEAILLSNDEPAPCQMACAVRGREGLEAIHVIAHGRAGEVGFAAGALSLESLAGYAVDLGAIGRALGDDGELLLWSCDTAVGARGSAFLEALESATGAEVRAATGIIGSPLRGGKWRLDNSSANEAVAAPLTARGMASYAGVLAPQKASPPTLTTVALRNPATGLTNADSLVFRVTFSEAVSNVDTADFVVTGGTTGTATNVALVSPGVYDVTVSGGNLANFNGTVGLALKSTGGGATIQDTAGTALTNFTTTGTSASYTEDNTAPTLMTVALRTPANALTNADSLVFRVTFSEAAINVNPADFVVTGGTTGTATNVALVSPGVYDVTVSGGNLANFNGTVGLALKSTGGGATIQDTAGTALTNFTTTGASASYTEDNTAPTLMTVALRTPANALTNADSLVFRVTFSEAVINVNPADFVVTGGTTGTATNVALVSPGVYDVTVSGGNLANFNGTVGLALKSTGGGATIQDTAGTALTNLTTTGASASYTEDNTAPTAVATVTGLSADSGSSNIDFYTNVASQTVSGTYTGTLGANETIQVSGDGSTWINATASAGIWSASGVTLSAGTGTLQVRTIDLAGNITSGTGHSSTLDISVPTAVATVTGLSADSGSSNTDFYTNVASQTVSGTYTGTLGANETIQVSGDGSTWINATASAGIWSASGVTLSAGTGTLQVRTIDLAGNITSGTGHSSTLDIFVPTAVATVTGLSADSGSSNTDFYTNVASQTVSGTYTGTLGANETIQVSGDGSTWINATASAGIWSASGVTLSAGTGTLQVRTIDLAGNITSGTGHSSTLDISVPTAVATVTGLSADSGSSNTDFYTNVASQTVSGTYAGTLGANETIQVSGDGSTWINATASAGIWSASGVTLSAGTGTLQVRTIDLAGNITSGTGHSSTLDIFVPTAVATVTGLSADSGSSNTDFYTNVASQTVSGTYTGTLGANETIQVSGDGSTWINATASAGIWSASGVTLSAGTGTLQVRTIDLAGNITSGTGHSSTLDIFVPTAVATVTGLSADSGSSNTDFYTNVASQTVSGTYTGTLGANETIQVSGDGSTWINATASAGIWSASGVTLSAGTGTLQVRTIDLAGNITSGTGHSYTLDIPTVIEAFGSTSLGQVGSNYFLYPNGGSAAELSYGGAPVVDGQFDQFGGHWVPIGAEQTANGYEVAWKVTGADQYTVWDTDNSGNYLSSAFDSASGTSAALQSFEPSFQQDLNGDGSIGIPPPPPPTVIEAFGSTSLDQVGSNYFLYPNGGSAAELSYGGAPVVDGQFDQFGGHWVPIGAEQTANGYEVAWKVTGADQYTVWDTDNSGNYLSSAFDSASGTSAALQSFEPSFQQDLNGDGSIGIPPPPPPTVIEAFGSTSLGQVGSNYFLYPNGGSAAELSYGGAPVVDGQFDQFGGHWVPIGAEQTANGYEVAWKVTGADQYTVWDTDNSGNYLSSAFDSASGTSAALQSFEPSFQQDLNGDGLIGLAAVSPPQFVDQGADANGVELYSVTWDTLGSHPFAVRVLAPDHPSTDYAHSFLYALPVEGGLAQSTYGSGLDELRQLGVENQYNATIIEPIFPIDPWYADNPLDATIDFETFMATLLPAWVNSNLATSGTEDDLLIGFSKSGYGALDLLFKHPDVFDAAAAWDFPADMTAYSNYGASGNYGTDSNFQNNYRLTGAFIDTWQAPFTTQDRIWISGYDVFETDVSDFDTLLTSYGVLHTLSTQPYDAHNWSSGWLSGAVAGLYGLDQQLNGNSSIGVPPPLSGSSASFETASPDSTSLLVQAMASFGSSGAPVNSSGALLGADPSQQSALAAPIDQQDNGAVSFSDGSHAPVVVNIVNGVPAASTVSLSGLNDGTVTATLHLNNDAAGNSFTNVVTTATLDQDKIAETPKLTAPSILTVAAGGSVPLGVVVSAVDSDDVLSVAISGVPSFESVTAAGATPTVTKHGNTSTYTFSALPASDWNNGLTLKSSYAGKGHPTNALTVTVSNTTTGESSTAAAKTISVTDPPAGNTIGINGSDQVGISGLSTGPEISPATTTAKPSSPTQRAMRAESLNPYSERPSTLGYAPNNGNTGGALAASDGVHVANIALLHQYAASSFAMASDGHAGTLITDPPVLAAQTHLTQPHA